MEKFGVQLLDAEDTIEVQDSKSIMAQVMMIQKEMMTANVVLLPNRVSASFPSPPLQTSQSARAPLAPTNPQPTLQDSQSAKPALQRETSGSALLRAQKQQQQADAAKTKSTN